jgi:hypothetical protein
MLYSQDGTQYKPTVAWKTLVDSVIYLNTDTFIVKVDPIDYNDPGAINRTIGGYLMDNFGHIYTIIDSTSTAITVVDEFDYNIAPVDGEIGIVYKSVGNGNAPYIAPVLYEFLDTRAKDNADRLFKDILWKQADLYPQDSAYIQFDSDTIIWDATKTDVQAIEDSLSYYMLTESFTDSIPTIKLTRFDSTGFRVTEEQILNLQHFTNADETDHVYAADSTQIKQDIAALQSISDAIETFTANSGQTNFTLTNSPTQEYTVSQNGVVLPPSAYTINTNTLALTVGVWENDRIQITYKYQQ